MHYRIIVGIIVMRLISWCGKRLRASFNIHMQLDLPSLLLVSEQSHHLIG